MPLLCAEVSLPTARAQSYDARSLRVLQAEYKHEAAVITYTYDEGLKSSCVTGAPVVIRWGTGTNVSVFRGYVHHVATDQRNQLTRANRTLDVVCVGATQPLNAPAYNAFRSARADAVVSELAIRAGFSTLIERHPYAWTLLQQQGESTWSFLVACAQRAGWTLYARDTDIRCHSRAIRYAGALLFRDQGMEGIHTGKALLAFNVIEAETLAGAAKKRERVATGVDTTGTVFTTTAGATTNLAGARAVPASLTEYRTVAARSISEAQAILKGEQELNRHYIRAKATVSGDAGLFATRTVRLLGVSADADGYWFTTRAEHLINETEYQVNLEVGKDSLGDPGGFADSSGRAVVYDPARGGGSIEAVRTAAPETTYADFTSVIPSAPVTAQSRWRASAPVERLLPPVARSPRRSA